MRPPDGNKKPACEAGSLHCKSSRDYSADAPYRTLYRGCGADAMRLYLTPTRERARRKRLGLPAPDRMTRAAMLDDALLLLDVESLLWPRDVLPYLEHNAQFLAALFAGRDEVRP
jgi:hypothetical protein